MARVVVITGCSTGVGKSLALLLAKKTLENGSKKYKVYATMRKPVPLSDEQFDNLIVAPLDVTSDDSVNQFKDFVASNNDEVSVVVNNAGYAIQGTHETNSIQQAKDQFETNFFGVLRVNGAFLPKMREKKEGHVIGVSSVGGLIGTPFNDCYCATKFALEGLFESMASTNKNFGIQTSLVEPGAILTAFVGNVDRPKADDLPETLRNAFTKYSTVMEAAFSSATAQSADQVAEVIITAIEDGENKSAHLRYQTSEMAKAIAGAKLKDPTGDSLVNVSYQRFFGSS